jgi:hypothetical protein
MDVVFHFCLGFFFFIGHLWHAGRARVSIAGNERALIELFIWSLWRYSGHQGC